MTIKRRSLLSEAGSIIAISFAMSGTAAYCQTAANAGDDEGVQEIIVTAQKRSENLQNVPISVAAMDSDRLIAAGISSSSDLNAAVPGLSVGTFANAVLPFIRGVGQLQAVAGIESPTAVYVDGIYLLSPNSALLSMNNVEQLAVLRGPQGTLFGRNATGGVVQVTTRTPSFTPTFSANFGYGNYDSLHADAYGSAPLGQKIATSLSVNWEDQMDGYGHNRFLNTRPFKGKSLALQSKTLVEPDDDTRITLNLFYDWSRYSPGTAIPPGTLAEDGVTTYSAPYTTFSHTDADSKNEQYIASLKLEHDFGGAVLTDIAAYHHFDARALFTLNAIPGNNVNPVTGATKPAIVAVLDSKGNTFTNELQLAAPEGQSFQWTAGIFYLTDTSRHFQIISAGNTYLFDLTGRVKTESYAGYGQATFPILASTRLTAGFRYTWDRLRFLGSSSLGTSPAASGIPTSLRNSAPSWRIAIDHDFTPEILGYVSYNRGFRSGRFVINNFTNPPVDPEYVDSYEAGLKSRLFDNRVRFNVTGFYYKYRDIQVRATTVGAISATVNAAAAEGKGVDIELEAVPVPRLTITGGAEILDAEYTRFPGGPCPTPLPEGGVNSTAVCDLSGKRLPFAPKLSAQLRASYELPTSIGTFTLSAGDSYSGKYYFEPDNAVPQKSFHNISASLAWESASGIWNARLWGRNLANEEIFSNVSTNSSVIYIPGKPRTYGVSVGFKF